MNSRKLVRFLLAMCGRHARNKKLSEAVMLLPFSKQWEMVQTYLNGDGDVHRRRAKDSETYRITTTSQTLAVQIQEILARGGMFSSIREIFKGPHLIEGRMIKKSKMYLISYKLRRSNNFVRKAEGYYLVPVKATQKVDYSGKVYNFQVSSEPNSYLVRGFAVHNCGAAVASSSILTEMIKGKTIDEALKITNKRVIEALDGLPPQKIHCSVLAEDALKSAINDYMIKSTGKGLPNFKPRSEKEHHH